MGNSSSSTADQTERLESVQMQYMSLYRRWERLDQQLRKVLDEKNIDLYLSDHDSDALDDAFEKIYITRYHRFLQQAATSVVPPAGVAQAACPSVES